MRRRWTTGDGRRPVSVDVRRGGRSVPHDERDLGKGRGDKLRAGKAPQKGGKAKRRRKGRREKAESADGRQIKEWATLVEMSPVLSPSKERKVPYYPPNFPNLQMSQKDKSSTRSPTAKSGVSTSNYSALSIICQTIVRKSRQLGGLFVEGQPNPVRETAVPSARLSPKSPYRTFRRRSGSGSRRVRSVDCACRA